MTRVKLGGVLIALTALMLTAVGCEDKVKQLEQRNTELTKQLGETRMAYNEAQNQIQVLSDQNKAKDAEISRLNGLLAAKPKTVGVPAEGAKGWEVGLTGDRVTLESDILFSAGKADLTAAGKGHLDKIAGDLKAKYSGMPVRVYGFTDTDPIKKTKDLWEDNLELSANRAMTVTRYLISKGVKATGIETVAMGEWHPLGSKDKSRRVEIIVIKAKAGAAAPPAAGGGPVD